MKRQIILLLILGAIAHSSQAQSELYKRYAHRKGINASYIAKYPIGNTRVSITMLEAESPETFEQLTSEIKALQPAKRRPMKRESDSTRREQLSKKSESPIDLQIVVDTNSSKEKTGSLRLHTLNMTDPKGATLYFRYTDPLPGDKGQYLIYQSSDTSCFLIFHTDNVKQRIETIEYLLEQHRLKIESQKK